MYTTRNMLVVILQVNLLNIINKIGDYTGHKYYATCLLFNSFFFPAKSHITDFFKTMKNKISHHVFFLFHSLELISYSFLSSSQNWEQIHGSVDLQGYIQRIHTVILNYKIIIILYNETNPTSFQSTNIMKGFN